MEKTTIINYKGNNIFQMDFSNTKSEQEIDIVINASIKYIRNKPLSSVLAVTNMKNMYLTL